MTHVPRWQDAILSRRFQLVLSHHEYSPTLSLRRPLRRAALLLAPLAAVAMGQDQSAPSAGRLNVLLICVDDLKPLLGCCGDTRVKSPNIDRLAAREVLFERAFANQAVCAPSRNALMTGKRPTTLGIFIGDSGTQALPPGRRRPGPLHRGPAERRRCNPSDRPRRPRRQKRSHAVSCSRRMPPGQARERKSSIAARESLRPVRWTSGCGSRCCCAGCATCCEA